MRIKKESKNNLDAMKLNSEENKKGVFLFTKWLSIHRLNSRNQILNGINFKTVSTFFPFALSFLQFFNHYTTSGKNMDFFQTNLPVFKSFKPRLNSDTFEYVVKPNASTNLQFYKALSKTDKFLSSNTGFFFGQPNFLAKIRNKKFNGLSCDGHIIPSGNFLSKTSGTSKIFGSLDELPSYVKGLNQDYSVQESLVLFSKTANSQGKNTLNIESYKLVPELTRTDTILDKKSEKTVQEPVKPSFKSIRNEFYQNRVDFYQTLAELNTELQNIFSEKTFSCPLINYTGEHPVPEKELENLINQYPDLDQEVCSDKILEHLEKIKISEELPRFRLMSGYNYPDTSSVDLHWFFNRNKNVGFNQLTRLKLHKATLPSFSENYPFSIKNLPKFSIQTKNVVLRDNEQNKVFYDGPSLVLDSKKGLDWKNSNTETLRSWFSTYLSPSNSLGQLRDNFFGNYYSPQFLKEGKTVDFSDFKNNSFFRSKYNPHPPLGSSELGLDFDSKSSHGLFVPFSSSLHVPYGVNPKNKTYNKNQSDIFDNIKLLEVKLSEKEKVNEMGQLLPLIQVQHPKLTTSKTSSKLFLGYSPLFEFGFKGNPDYSFSTNIVDQHNSLTKLSSGRYKKTASFFPKSTLAYADNWEPLTSNSWLVISQLSFAVFVFHVLKSLSDTYGRELLGYLLDLVAQLGFLDKSKKQQIDNLMGNPTKGYRILFESRKNFTDVVGIQKLLPEIYEVVWFLRNSGREFAVSKNLPRGILLTGPAGTGKTLLVQAIAGEAQVPVVVLSGSSLIEPDESSSDKLQTVFQEARQIAPCIVFIDEIDTLSAKRSGMVQNPMGPDAGLEVVLDSLSSYKKETQGARLQLLQPSQENPDDENQALIYSSMRQLSLLTRLLIELDGIQGRDGVVVIGATNRPEVLDAALLRPGRFDKIIQVGLPGHEKRIEILQFYGQSLGYQNTIPWDYLGQLTAGFSAADLATLMNESTIKAILNQTTHTVQTIEHGIDRLTTSESGKYTIFKVKSTFKQKEKVDTLSITSKMSILRFAYYQAGKVVLSHLLETHPKSVVASLWPRRPSIRSVQIMTNLENSTFEFARLCEVTDRLIYCYAGKAAEFLFLQQFASGTSQTSTLGLEDLLFAQQLVYSILDKWYFYTKRSLMQKTLTSAPNVNPHEFQRFPRKLDTCKELVKYIENPQLAMKKALEADTSSLQLKKDKQKVNMNDQTYYSIPWWQQETSDELEFNTKNFSNATRLYLYNSERTTRNPEWYPPDEFYHSASSLKNVKTAFANIKRARMQTQTKSTEKPLPTRAKSKSQIKGRKYFPWNDITRLTRDYPAHSLVLQSFNKALLILNQNRELLDRLVVELLYHEILRQPEVDALMKDFQNKQPNVSTQQTVSIDPLKKQPKVQILEDSWGPQSRKPLPRWIDFAQFQAETT